MTTAEATPRAPECERSIVRMLMQYPAESANRIFAKLTPSIDITAPRERAIIEAFGRVYRDTGTADPMLVAKALDGHPEFRDLRPAGALLEYTGHDEFESFTFLDGRINEVLDKTERRKLLSISEAIAEGARNCQAPAITRKIAQADLDDLQRSAATDRPRFVGITAAELAAARFERSYIIEGVFSQHEPMVGGGGKKTLKTSTALDEALSVATGLPYLGHFTVNRPCNVLFCSGESGSPTLQETAIRICRSKGIDLSEVPGFTLTEDLPRLNDADSMRDFGKFLADSGAELLILDPLYLMLSGDDAGNLFKQGAQLREIAGLCRSLGVTLDLRHHTKSTLANPFKPGDLDDLAWSGCAEFARQWQLLSRREEYEPGSGMHRLWLSVGGSAGHGGLWALDIDEGRFDDPGGRRWAVTVTKAEEARDHAQQRKAEAKAAAEQKILDDDRAAVCRVLAKNPNGLTKTAIGERAGIPTRRWPRVFSAMYTNGELVECEVMVSNHKKPTTGYRLEA